MFRGFITTLFAGIVVTGLTSTAYAKPRVQTQPAGGFTTRSGASLRGLENRSISQDLPTILSDTADTSSVAVPAPILLHQPSESVAQPPSITVFGEKIELGTKRGSRNSSNQAPSHVGVRNVQVSAGGSSTDSEQLVKVQYQLLSDPER
ncbi:MAG TPA: hypothetical protein V6D26_06975 [Stenomitos sp.]